MRTEGVEESRSSGYSKTGGGRKNPSTNLLQQTYKGVPLPYQHVRLTGTLNGLIRALAVTYYAYLRSN